METLKQIISDWHIDPIVLLLVIAAGFFQNTYLIVWVPFKKLPSKYNASVRTLVCSFLFVTAYVFILKSAHTWTAEPGTYFLSYTAATSLYEVLIYPLVIKRIASITHTEVTETDGVQTTTTTTEKIDAPK